MRAVPSDRARLRVLLLVGDAAYARAVESRLGAQNGSPWEVDTVADLARGRERLARGNVDVVLADFDLTGEAGLEGLPSLCAAAGDAAVVILVGPEDEPVGLAALEAGAQEYLAKGPIDLPLLTRTLRYAVDRKRTAGTLMRLEQAVGTMQLGVTITDVNGHILYTNAAEAAMHGYSVPEMLGMDARDLSPPANWSPLRVQDLRDVRMWKRERVRLRKDGTSFPVQLMSDVIRDTAGHPLGIVTTCEDISERWEAEEALRESEERYALAARGTNDGLWDWNLRTGRAYFSPRWKSMLGHDDSEVATAIDEWFGRIHPDDRDRVQRKIEDHLQGLSPRFEDEHRMRHKDGSYRWVLSRGFASRSYQGRPYRMAGAQTDVTDRRAYDPLTGLPNRVLFAERLDDALVRHRTRKGHFAVLFVDLDRFKAVNDTFGHVAGDQLLVEVARRLEASVRPGDTVARFAGDEFAILLERIQDVADATGVADRVHRALATPVVLSDHETVPSASVGVALSLTPYERADDVVRDADAAMYRAKQEGGGRWEICDEAMRERVASRARMQRDLRSALDGQELSADYQPVADLVTGELRGFEVLLRWRGLLLPLDFLVAAEAAGGILRIETWLLREACAQAGRWRARYGLPFRLSLNVSTPQFLRGELAADLRSALDAGGFPGAALDLEVGEDTLLCDASAVAAAFGTVNALGVGVVLDRFGVGYGSINALRRFRLRGLKLDAGLTSATDRETATLLPALLGLAASLALPVTATGVETEAERARLQALGCAEAQGGLFSSPLDAQSVEAILAHGGGALPSLRRGVVQPVASTRGAPSP
ncbi:MAG TPA: EAL domain-containing protein [Vicinamibacteria bacterium]|nr:EAL domain-containing protein [Vicinamibacteria bacterium]